MNFSRRLQSLLLGGIALAITSGAALAVDVVAGPATDPACMVPWADDTKFFQFPKKEGPYRVALANGYIANSWRIQMIQTAKAYAAQPEIAAKLKEFKVISTGEDAPAQISAINNFIDFGLRCHRGQCHQPHILRPGDQARQEKQALCLWLSTTSSTHRMPST